MDLSWVRSTISFTQDPDYGYIIGLFSDTCDFALNYTSALTSSSDIKFNASTRDMSSKNLYCHSAKATNKSFPPKTLDFGLGVVKEV